MKNTNNSALTKLNIWVHRLYGQIQSSIMTFGINNGYFISLGAALFSVLKLVVPGFLCGWGSLIYDINTWWPIAITIFSTGFTTIASIVKYKNSSYRFSIIQDGFYKNKVIGNIKLSEKQIANGYSIKSFYNGVSEEKYIISDDINLKLIRNQDLKVNKLNFKFQLADEIKKYVPSVLKRNFMSDRIIFNGKLIRMASDLFMDSESINIQNVRYFEGQCTNEIVYKQIKSNFSLGPLFSGERLLFNEENVLYDLELSLCANYIGASTLVITKDNYIIIGKQGDFSRANAGRYAPSGSGSVSYKDLKSSGNFSSLVINAMEREFREENNYVKAKKMKTTIVGYVRLLERGGKPDFFGISYIDENSSGLKNKIKKMELGITEESLLIRKPDNLGIGDTLLQFCNTHIPERKISIQLLILAELIKQYEQTIGPLKNGWCN